MDSVLIEDLKIAAIVGIHAWEREVPQEILLSLEMQADIFRAARTGDIRDALDYSAVVSSVDEFIKAGQFFLLETMAEQTARMVMDEYSVPWLRLRIQKTQVMSNTRSVGVCIERGKRNPGVECQS